MLGIILCGGKSLRMGNDKGLLKLEAKTWAQTAIDKISVLKIPVKISVNKEQYSAYAEAFSAGQLIVDEPLIPFRGPLQGLLSCHLDFPEEDLFILACDMPLMEPAMLQTLYQSCQENPLADAHVFMNDGEPEPLCGIYTARGLDIIQEMQKKGTLIKHSMKFMLDNLKVNTIELDEDEKKYFRNFNAHSELNGL
jgi:molybdopterin-guanine dinucleotide biosynthesis protein A